MNIEAKENLFLRTNEIRNNRQSIWFLHGFADSGLAYREVFESALNADYNIYIIDLPGFGVSPINSKYNSIKEHSDLVTQIINKETSSQKEVNIVAHSLGALIGTWVCEKLKDKINYYFNIEGNLTTADSYFSSKPTKYESAQEFAISFEKEIFKLAESNERYKLYYSSLKFATPEGMRNWSLTSQDYIKENRCGFEFKELSCKKVYIWGDIDTPKETQLFIEKYEIPNHLFNGVGHWHMVENAPHLYHFIHEKIDPSNEVLEN